MGEDEVVVEDGVALWVCGSLILIVCGRSWGVRDGLMEEFPTNEAGQPVSESENPVAREGGPERLWATILHLSDLFGLAFPFGNILAPLVIWLIKRVELPAIDRVGKAVLNFQISWTIYFLVASAKALVGSCLIFCRLFFRL